MALRIVDIADGYQSETVPSVVSVVGLRSAEVIISASHIIAGKITLVIAPAVPSTLTLHWNGVCQYESNNDFSISGADIIFTGKNLESLLSNGDLIRVTYQ